MILNQDPALTSARVDALNAVDLRLVGVTHGATSYAEDYTPHVEGGNSDDFDRLMTAASELDAGRGDRLAVEPTGFKSAFVERTGIYFQTEDIARSLSQIISQKVDFPKPKLRVKRKQKPIIDKIASE